MDKSIKILTISVAAYNVEGYIRECLESCCLPEIIDDLEIFVINDGSSDGTSSIAREFEKRYPQSITVFDKPNGGYGSTVNTSMKLATGKFFKLLDGDDWFNKDGLLELVNYLRSCEEDWVINDYVRADASSGDTVQAAGPGEKKGQSFSLSDVGETVRPSMWHSTFKRSIQVDHPFQLPEHCLYTDALFVANQLKYVDTVKYLNAPLYCYRCNAREEQSTSIVSRQKHYMEEIAVFKEVLGLAIDDNYQISDTMIRRVRTSEYNAITSIMCCEISERNRKLVRSIDQDLKRLCEPAYESAGRSSKKISTFTYH